MNNEIKKPKILKHIYVLNEVTGEKVKPGLVIFDPDSDEIIFISVQKLTEKHVVTI